MVAFQRLGLYFWYDLWKAFGKFIMFTMEWVGTVYFWVLVLKGGMMAWRQQEFFFLRKLIIWWRGIRRGVLWDRIQQVLDIFYDASGVQSIAPDGMKEKRSIINLPLLFSAWVKPKSDSATAQVKTENSRGENIVVHLFRACKLLIKWETFAWANVWKPNWYIYNLHVVVNNRRDVVMQPNTTSHTSLKLFALT